MSRISRLQGVIEFLAPSLGLLAPTRETAHSVLKLPAVVLIGSQPMRMLRTLALPWPWAQITHNLKSALAYLCLRLKMERGNSRMFLC